MTTRAAPFQPIPPDFAICAPTYGTGISSADCFLASSGLSLDVSPHTYIRGGSGPYSVPWSATHGTCQVDIAHTGPGSESGNPIVVPYDLLQLAYGIIITCVAALGGQRSMPGWGGFGTLGLGRILNAVRAPSVNLQDLSNAGHFFTVTVKNPRVSITEPGKYDTMIPLHFWDQIIDPNGQPQSPSISPWFKAQLAMSRSITDTGGNRNALSWWDAVKGSFALRDEMMYTCDAALGVPREADCKQLGFSQLGPPSDTVFLSSGSNKSYSSNDCSFAVESFVDVMITWAQITVALDTLINLCVSTARSVTGGKAYYYSSAQRHKRDVISGLNALPSGVNLTLYQTH